MDFEKQVESLFTASIAVHQLAVDHLCTPVARAAGQILAALQRGDKLLICGNGGSAADAQHFAAELVNRFETERPALPALALTTDSSVLTSIANDTDFQWIFARQVAALGRSGDILLAISTSGGSTNIVRAIQAAQNTGMKTILLTGECGGKCHAALGDDDLSIQVPSTSTARVQEIHLLILHCLCSLVDSYLSMEASEGQHE